MKEKLHELTKDMWTIPNVLTMSRLVMIPIFVILYMNGQPYWALGVFCLASQTDCFDGLLARKLNQITNFGKLFDPLADKLMVISALVCHVIKGVFPWPALAIIAVKELLMVIGGAVLLKKGVVAYANMYGKVATVAFMAALIAGFFKEPLDKAGAPVYLWLLWAAVGLSLLALVTYASDAIRKLKTSPTEAEANPNNLTDN